jgi:hypothetical protein
LDSFLELFLFLFEFHKFILVHLITILGTRKNQISSENPLIVFRVCLNFDFGDLSANIILNSVIFLLKLPAFDCEKCLLQNNISSKNHSNANSKHTLRVCLNFDFGDLSANSILNSVIFLLKLPAFDCEKCLLQNNISSKNHSNANSKHTLRTIPRLNVSYPIFQNRHLPSRLSGL